MQSRVNPLFDENDQTPKISVLSSEVSEAANNIPLSPISKRPMKRVVCDGIPAYFCEEGRLVLPIKE